MTTLPVKLPFPTLPMVGESLYPNAAMKRTTAVTNEYLVMTNVCGKFQSGQLDPVDATTRMDAAITQLTNANAELSDPNLTREIELMQKLKQNLGLSGGMP